jgi:tetratricopeptide (TPR) repeat protein
VEAHAEPKTFAKGRYVVEARLGEGGMGVVYRTYDRELDARVALKTLRRVDASAIYRFKREFRALADVSHPNLVTLHELVAEDDRWFFTMELVDGVDFLTYVRNFDPERTIVDGQKRFDEPRLRSALRDLAIGIEVLHENGRFHRDIKPSNVLVTKEGRVVILDFGLVTMLAEESADPDQMTNLVVGTIGYMAPEQAAGMPVNSASDWYSVGVMLFEALTAERPYTGKPFEIALKKQKQDAPEPRSIAPVVPEDLDRLTIELLQRNPRRRPDGASILKRLGAMRIPKAASSLMGIRLAKSEGVRTLRARPGRSSEGVVVGRELHLRFLHEAYAATKDRRTVIAYVRGSSGMGKSLLVRRFLDEVTEKDAPIVLAGRCYERESVPFKALDTVVDALCRHLMRLPSEDVAALMSDDVVHLARVFPVLWRVRAIRMGLGPHPARAGGLVPPLTREDGDQSKRSTSIHDPREHRRRAFSALRFLFERLAGMRPVIVFIDDLQWSDLDSAQLLFELFRPPNPPPIMMLAAYRSEDVETSAPLREILRRPKDQAIDVADIAVDPLGDKDALELVDALLEPSDETLAGDERSTIVREARGNPFVIDELVRHTRRRKESETTGEITYEDALALRLLRLPDRARTLLELVCVSGRPILQLVALRAIEGGGDNQAALVRLLTEHLIRTRIFGEEEALEAYHDRIRESVTRRLSEETLAGHHRALIRMLEALESPDHEALVEHFLAIGEIDPAARHAATAAQKAAEALAFDHAARLYRIALQPKVIDGAERAERSRGLGDALSNLGRGKEAAAAYLEGAAFSTSPDLALDLRRRAAEQLLRSGHVDEGAEVLGVVLSAVGMALAPTPRRALFSLALHRVEVRLRGLRFEPRKAETLTSAELARIDVLWSVSLGLAMVETARGADFQARHLLLALAAGEPHRVARALAMEAAYSATGGGSSEPRTRDLIARAESLAKALDDPHALGLARYAAGVAAFLTGRFLESRQAAKEAEAIFRDRCVGVAWELASARVFHLWSVGILGDLVEFVRMIDVNLRDTEDRGDRYAGANYRMGLANLAWLIRDDPEGARRQIDEVMGAWSQRGFHIQHYYQLISETGLDLYLGRGQEAHRRLTARWPDLERSLLLRVQFIRIDALATRARASIAAAHTNAADRVALLSWAERDAKRIANEKMAWADPIARKLLGGVLAARGSNEEAAAHYRAAFEGFSRAHMALYEAVARHRCGALIGGDEGRRMVDAVERSLTEQGVRKPTQIVSMIAP